MNTPLLGICRFSFLGHGDWQIWNSEDRTPADIRAELAKTLYQPDRIEPRFWTFEHLLLNSLKAQTDQNFGFLVLTSPDMPAALQRRLRDLCDTLPQIQLLISDAGSVQDAILPEIARLENVCGAPAIQFRIDDDDCLSADYIERLRSMTNRMSGIRPLAYTRPRGLVLTLYADEPARYYDLNRAYHSAGAALLPPRDRTVFDFAHFMFLKRFTGVIDTKGRGSLAVKCEGHDAVPIEAEKGKFAHTPIEADRFAELIGKDFPFLKDVDFEQLRALVK